MGISRFCKPFRIDANWPSPKLNGSFVLIRQAIRMTEHLVIKGRRAVHAMSRLGSAFGHTNTQNSHYRRRLGKLYSQDALDCFLWCYLAPRTPASTRRSAHSLANGQVSCSIANWLGSEVPGRAVISIWQCTPKGVEAQLFKLQTHCQHCQRRHFHQYRRQRGY